MSVYQNNWYFDLFYHLLDSKTTKVSTINPFTNTASYFSTTETNPRSSSITTTERKDTITDQHSSLTGQFISSSMWWPKQKFNICAYTKYPYMQYVFYKCPIHKWIIIFILTYINQYQKYIFMYTFIAIYGIYIVINMRDIYIFYCFKYKLDTYA